MATQHEDYNGIYDIVYAMFKKRKTILDVFNKYKDDPSDRHVACAMYLMMDSKCIDDINILATLQGDNRKTVKAFELEEDRHGNGTYKRYCEDLAVDTGCFKGSHVNVILNESVPYEGDFKCGSKRVVAGLTVRSGEIDLKILIKS